MLPVAAALSLGTLAPAQAMGTDPVTDLSAAAVQAPGTSPDRSNFTVTATWTADAASPPFSVQILDGSCDPAHAYSLTRDVRTTRYTATLSNLADDTTYCVSVTTAGAATTTATFTTPVADTTAPEGRYKVSPASAYIVPDFAADSDLYEDAAFRVTQISADSDVASRRVLAGDGTPAHAWNGRGAFTLRYVQAGTFTPHVLIADRYGNTRDIALSAVHVLSDRIPPRIKVTRPAKPGHASSWRVIHGTATDRGSGIRMVMVFVAERRDGVWWTYNFRSKHWTKGARSFMKTMLKTSTRPQTITGPKTHHWRTKRVKGLTQGTLRIFAFAADGAENFARASVRRTIH